MNTICRKRNLNICIHLGINNMLLQNLLIIAFSRPQLTIFTSWCGGKVEDEYLSLLPYLNLNRLLTSVVTCVNSISEKFDLKMDVFLLFILCGRGYISTLDDLFLKCLTLFLFIYLIKRK